MTYNTINDAMTMDGGEGTLLAGRYRIVRQLGQGGMGSVWLAEDSQLDGKLFAIKMLPSILVSNKRAYRQLKDEALVAMKLTHSNIVTLRAFEENDGNPFLVMDYIDGQTLDDYLAERGTIGEEETIKLLRPIADALDYAHAKGVVHRDVKPGNVMIAKDGTPFILDFGIAREMQETMTRVTGKLSSGTLLYMSPEQLNGDPPKAAQDIYSFAAMAYECLKGEPPFVRGAIEDQIKSKAPDPLGPHIIISGLVAQGLAKKPEDRPATCLGLIEGDGFNTDAQRRRGTEARGGGGSRWLTIVLALATIAVAGVAYWRFSGVADTDAHPEYLVPATTETDPSGDDLPPEAPGETDVPPATLPDSGLTRPQNDTKPEPVSPPKLDPVFVKMTNSLAEAVKERNLEYDKAKPFRRSPRGFANRLKRIDDHWTKIKALYAPNEIDKVRTAIDAVRKETAELRDDIKWMSENIKKREDAVAQEKKFNKFYDDEKKTNAILFAKIKLRPEWEVVKSDMDSAKKSLDDGLFGEAMQSYSGLQPLIVSMLEDERGIEKGKKGLPVTAQSSRPSLQPLQSPSMTVVAMLNGREVRGAKMKKMDEEVTLPYKWGGALSKGRSFGPYIVTYSDGVVNYAGEFAITVDWNGHRNVSVELRRLRPGEVPGGVRAPPKGRGSWAF